MKSLNQKLRTSAASKKVNSFKFAARMETLIPGEFFEISASLYLNARFAAYYYTKKFRPNEFKTELNNETATVKIIRVK